METVRSDGTSQRAGVWWESGISTSDPNITPELRPDTRREVGADGFLRYGKRVCQYAVIGWYSEVFTDFRPFTGAKVCFFQKQGGLNMNKKTIEIRWHGRGGQGAKTACLLLADAAFASGKYVQGFPEYGPERMGAPITAYNRISSEPCTIHSNIYKPDYVVVVDESLLSSVDVTAGLNPEGGIVINSAKDPENFRPLLNGYTGKVYTIDARRISEEHLGGYFPNTPMLAAIVKVSRVVEPERFVADMEASFRHKFATKPQVIAGNMNCLTQSMKEVRGA